MIIGLVGFKQVGKSTAAKYLEEKYGAGRCNMKDQLVAEMKQNFPDLLQAILNQYPQNVGFDSEPMSVDYLFEAKPALMRALMQNYGTEVRRKDDANYWCDRWFESVNKLDEKIVVVDDVRFMNEADYVKKFKSIIIRLERGDVSSGGTHASETEQLKIPAEYTITCDKGDFEHLYSEIDKIMSKHK